MKGLNNYNKGSKVNTNKLSGLMKSQETIFKSSLKEDDGTIKL